MFIRSVRMINAGAINAKEWWAVVVGGRERWGLRERCGNWRRFVGSWYQCWGAAGAMRSGCKWKGVGGVVMSVVCFAKGISM